MAKRSLTVTFDPAEGLVPVTLPNVITVPQTASTVPIFEKRQWAQLLEPFQQESPHAVAAILEAPLHERLELFCKSGLAHKETAEGTLLENIVYGALEHYCRTHQEPVHGIDDPPPTEKLLEAVFVMFRLYLQAGNVMVLASYQRDWFANVLELAFNYIRPFVCEESTDEVFALIDTLRSNGIFDVLISVDQPCWQQHWTIVLSNSTIKQELLSLYTDALPIFCRRIEKLDAIELEYLSTEYFDRMLERDENYAAVFALFINFVRATGSVFEMGPIATTVVFSN